MSDEYFTTEKHAELCEFEDPATGRTHLLMPHELPGYERLHARITAQYKPEDYMEATWVAEIVHHTWMMRRYCELPRSAYSTTLQNIISSKAALIAACAKHLVRTQTRRRAEREKMLDRAAILAQRNFSRGETYNPDFDFPPENGFVFAISEIEAHIERRHRLAEGKAAARKEARLRRKSQPPA